MLELQFQQQLLHLINKATGLDYTQAAFEFVGGGSINQTFKVTIKEHSYFLKLNSASLYPEMFKKEKYALEHIASTKSIATPNIIFEGQSGTNQLLLLQWVESGKKEKGFWKSFGQQLAALHLNTNTNFGWDEDNYMGSVPQQNKWEQNWTEFFKMQRLHPIIQQCVCKKLLTHQHQKAFENLFNKLPFIFNDDEKPALIHGDLWSGNFMCNSQQQPVLIDPASYYGHRSMDLGMTTLFGGFDPSFYEAYHYYFPMPPNYKDQWLICNLYPLLIHLLLFGDCYLPQIQQTLHKFV